MADPSSISTIDDDDEGGLRRSITGKQLFFYTLGDVLGSGIYVLIGLVAAAVGGAFWIAFAVGVSIAAITGTAYAELVTKYPQAAGAALYTHKAFGIHFVTFLVAFAVMSSGITSASTASNAFAGFINAGFALDLPAGGSGLMFIALGFMALVAAINFRGVGESVKANVVLTLVELSGLLLIIFIGMYAVTQGNADFSRVMVFESPSDKSTFLAITAATSLAFFAMVGFEDSVNMAEECEDPIRDFPKTMLTGLGVTGVIYLLVSITAVALVPVGDLTNADLGPALNQVVAAGAPELPFDKIFPFIGMFAVANSALINMLMASRLLYGMARQDVLPRSLGRVHATRRTPWVAIIFTTLLSFGLIVYVVRASASEDGLANITLLGGTTALLLLCVFTVVNIALLVLRKQPVDHDHFRAPTFLPVIGALSCAFLAGPWARADTEQYRIAGLMMAVGLVLWVLTWLTNRGVRAKKTGFRDIDHLEK
ncbi:MAG TPA: APC family permease [Nocardioides sp.]|nr:APC family permease [Nocardioides sp.]